VLIRALRHDAVQGPDIGLEAAGKLRVSEDAGNSPSCGQHGQPGREQAPGGTVAGFRGPGRASGPSPVTSVNVVEIWV
jgi:hypothetical protein